MDTSFVSVSSKRSVDAVRCVLEDIAQSALQAVSPKEAVLRHLRREQDALCVLDAQGQKIWRGALSSFRRICVLGAGKGAAPMAKAVEAVLGEWISDGLIVVKYGHDLPELEALERVRVLEAGHPVPDMAGQQAAEALLAKAKACEAGDLVIAVITGGASALTPALHAGLCLEDMQSMTQQMLTCGASIHELNTLRKHCSVFSGGQLAKAVFPAKLVTLIVSDVVGDELDVIASGATVPDPSTYADCMEIVAKYRLEHSLSPAILRHFAAGIAGRVAETPKEGDAAFEGVTNVLVASVGQALAGAAAAAERLGFVPRIMTSSLMGEAREQALMLIGEALHIRGDGLHRPVCLLAGGETTVTVRGTGKGGRNQEMALAALLALEGEQGIHMVCLGTDGTDGATDAAGGFAFSGILQALRHRGLEPEAALENNDSYHCLEQAGCLLRTGATRTNVMDVVCVLIDDIS